MAEPLKKKGAERKTVYKYLNEEGGNAEFKEFWKEIKNGDFDLDELDADEKKTALMYCVKIAQTEKAWVLLEFFADPNILSGEGKTALDYALEDNKKEFQFLLLLFGANPHIHDDEKKNEAPTEKNDDGEEKKDNNEEVKEIEPEKLEELEKLQKIVDQFKETFIFLTRKRRKHLRYIFQYISQNSAGYLDESGLAQYYRDYYPMDDNKAIADAHKFIEICGQSKIDDQDKTVLTYEDFLIAMLKLTKVKGLGKLDEFINVFMNKYREKKRIDREEEAARQAAKNNKEQGS